MPAARVEAPLQRAVLASLLLLCWLLGWDVCFAAGSVVAPACWPHVPRACFCAWGLLEDAAGHVTLGKIQSW